MATQSTKLREIGLEQADGTFRATVYDRVGPLRLLEHIVQAEMAARYAGLRNESDPVPVDIRALVVDPRTS